MEIVDKRSNVSSIKFDELNVGEVFLYCLDNGLDTSIFPYLKIAKFGKPGYEINAIGLLNGNYYFFTSDKKVKRVNCRLEIID